MATRRLRPLAPVGALFVVLIAVLMMARWGPRAWRIELASRPAMRAAVPRRDTTALAAALQSAHRALQARDSVVEALAFRAEQRRAGHILSPEALRTRDSLRALLMPLDAAIDRAARAPLPSSYRALAEVRALAPHPVARAAIDSLATVERARRALDPAVAPPRAFAELTEHTNRIGASLQALARTRRIALAREIAAREAMSSTPDSSLTAALHDAREARDSARWREEQANAALRAIVRANDIAASRDDSLARTMEVQVMGTSPLAVALATGALLFALVFTGAVMREVRHPTIANAREMERIAGLPVLAFAEGFRVPREGRARLSRPAGSDPFRMVYLTLSTGGARGRGVCVTGVDAALTAAVAGRIAVSAATDERATLVVDLSPGVPATAAYFGGRHEPGFTEALAGVSLWREVARSVSATDALAIDVIPAGLPRGDTDAALQDEQVRQEFGQFLGEYDFSVLVAANPSGLATASRLIDHPSTLLVARTARTPMQELLDLANSCRKHGGIVEGIILV